MSTQIMGRCALRIVVSAGLGMSLAGCGNDAPSLLDTVANAPLPGLLGARALSNHYVEVTFAAPVGATAQSASRYLVTGTDGSVLNVESVSLLGDGRRVLLATDPQRSVEYALTTTGSAPRKSSIRAQQIGGDGVKFNGSSVEEPSLETAIALSNTEILLTFSEPMDRVSAENVAFYHLQDPDGDTDVDITITAAELEDGGTTLILTTTPQDNIEYTVKATNVKSFFACSDGSQSLLDDTAQGSVCGTKYRSQTTAGGLSSFTMTARSRIDSNSPLDPDADGEPGTVTTSGGGVGVQRENCQGDADISGSGADRDEELIFVFDAPVPIATVILGLADIDFADDEPVLFLSDDASPDFNYTVSGSDLADAFNVTGSSRGLINFGDVSSLPEDLLIDAFVIRETKKSIAVASLCFPNGRRIDPTHNTASFFGLPAVDTVAPALVSAVSTGDSGMIVSFSEPVAGEAADPINFTIIDTAGQNPDLVVLAAIATLHDTQIILRTTPQLADVIYSVTVTGVHDKAGNLIDAAQNSVNVSFAGGPETADARTLPRVVGAVSTGNTSVLVTFSKAMGQSAINPSSYIIGQDSVNPEAGTLLVGSALFVNGDPTTVELTTLSQNELTYTLTVVNARDVFGNHLAPPELLVNPSTALFPGTPFSCSGLSHCNNGQGGTDGNGLCGSDHDCDDDPPCEEDEQDCVASCVLDPCNQPDFDLDGLPDDEEQRGWEVTVIATDGTITTRDVTSNPFVADTDGDGLSDFEEKSRLSDPRDTDTDDDALSDGDEAVRWRSSLTLQDTDGDGLPDGQEVNLWKTSPILADTDGDQSSDADEVLSNVRNARVAELPTPALEIGEVTLEVDERFTFTDETGVEQSLVSSTQLVLTQSEARSLSTSDTSTIETVDTSSQSFELEIKNGWGKDGGGSTTATLGFGFEQKRGRGYSFNISEESAQSSQEAFQESVSESVSFSERNSVTRTVEAARLSALVTLSNAGDIAFTLSNLQVTVSVENAVNRGSFIPLATLLPTGSDEFNLGTLNTPIGPLVFENSEIFASTALDLLRAPRAMIFNFANFDVVDELERNFAFTSQEVTERTAGLTIDFGDGTFEQYRVATANGFNNDASPRPITMQEALRIVGISRVRGQDLPIDEIALSCGPDGVVDTVVDPVTDDQPAFTLDLAIGDEIQPGRVLIRPGPNGSVDTEAIDDDFIDTDRNVLLDGGNGIVNTIVDDETDDEGAFELMVGDLVEPGRRTILAGPDRRIDTERIGDDVVQAVEVLLAGDDGTADTQADPATDDIQIVPVGTDGLDPETVIIEGGLNAVIDTEPEDDDPPLDGLDTSDPSIAETYGTATNPNNGLEVLTRIRSTQMDLRDGNPDSKFWFPFTSVRVPDTTGFSDIQILAGETYVLALVQDADSDGVFARQEFLAGTSDNNPDTDGDGMGDFDELNVGWTVEIPGNNYHTFSSPIRVDIDRDGIADIDERTLRSDPFKKDTDEDGLTDGQEWLEGYEIVLFDGDDNDSNNPVLSVQPYTTQGITPGEDGIIDTSVDPNSDDVEVMGTIEPWQRFILPGPNNVIDSVPGGDDVIRGPALIQAGTNGVADTSVDSDTDDIQVVPQGTTDLSPEDVIIEGGENGRVDTVPAGDDRSRAGHDGLFATSLLDADTDGDLLSDGREQLLGSDPNDPTDAGTVVDTDGDGLKDAEELNGWTITVDGVDRVVTSDPLLPDTDGDGLPDLLERKIRTDPNLRDTDIDGVNDREEFDPDDPAGYFPNFDFDDFLDLCGDPDLAPECAFVPSEDPLGTDPLRRDTDGDGLTEGEELAGWDVSVVGEVTYHVTSDPLSMDPDNDGLNDDVERNLGTDPHVLDTDRDGVGDGTELDQGQRGFAIKFGVRNPLEKDQLLLITYISMKIIDDCEADGADGEFTFQFGVKDPNGGFRKWLNSQDTAREFGGWLDVCGNTDCYRCVTGCGNMEPCDCSCWVQYGDGETMNIPPFWGGAYFVKTHVQNVQLWVDWAEIDNCDPGDGGPFSQWRTLSGEIRNFADKFAFSGDCIADINYSGLVILD